MADTNSEKFHARAKAWAAKNNLHGPSSFLRFVMFTYMDCLLKESDQFILKGGNLLWLYIRTPRHTVDLDLVTTGLYTTSKLKRILEDANQHAISIKFVIKSIKEILKDDVKGSAIAVQFFTDEGATNAFEIDILYALKTNSIAIPSPISPGASFQAASLENIVADKISACHRFAGGNTRMKDFDDLWRLSRSGSVVNWNTIKKISRKDEGQLALKSGWLNSEIIQYWKRHAKRYKDLPDDLGSVISDINRWLFSPIKVDEVKRISIPNLNHAFKNHLLDIASIYYQNAEIGLEKEMKSGNFVYFCENSNGNVGAFLIVNLNHASEKICGHTYDFTYLGLGCALSKSMSPIFLQVKKDAEQKLDSRTVVLHLTSSTPFAYQAILKSFKKDVFPISGKESTERENKIAEYLKYTIHAQVPAPSESPFILRRINKGRFNKEEIERIKGFRGSSPIFEFNIDHGQGDELIIFHTFQND